MKKLFVIGIAALLLVAFTVPAMAKVKIGGIIFTDFYYMDRNKENSAFRRTGTGETSFNNTVIQLPNITRLYARWTNEDNVGLYIEMGMGQTTGDTVGSVDSGVNLRHAYGWWDINPMFRIMVGKSTTPFAPLLPSQLIGVRTGGLNVVGLGYGPYYSGRHAQIRGTFTFSKNVKLAIALADPNGWGNDTSAAWAAAYNFDGPWNGQEGQAYQANSKLPRVDFSVPLTFGSVKIYPGFLYQRKSVDRLIGTSPPFNQNGGVDNTLDTWITSIGTRMGFGPFGLAAEFNYGENWGNTRNLEGASMPCMISGASLVHPSPGTSEINDAETYGFWVDLYYKFGPVTPHLIYGQMKTKNKTDVGPTVADTEAKSQMWGVSCPIDLAKGFRIRPEIMFYDDGDLKTAGSPSEDLGKYAIYGVQFQITF